MDLCCLVDTDLFWIVIAVSFWLLRFVVGVVVGSCWCNWCFWLFLLTVFICMLEVCLMLSFSFLQIRIPMCLLQNAVLPLGVLCFCFGRLGERQASKAPSHQGLSSGAISGVVFFWRPHCLSSSNPSKCGLLSTCIQLAVCLWWERQLEVQAVLTWTLTASSLPYRVATHDEQCGAQHSPSHPPSYSSASTFPEGRAEVSSSQGSTFLCILTQHCLRSWAAV